MISGAAVSLYAAVAVASIVRIRVFVLYVLLAVTGACAAGYAGGVACLNVMGQLTERRTRQHRFVIEGKLFDPGRQGNDAVLPGSRAIRRCQGDGSDRHRGGAAEDRALGRIATRRA